MLSARQPLLSELGCDVKFAYYVVRLLLEVEQLLADGDMNIESNSEQLKVIRRGEWSLENHESFFSEKEKNLESFYIKSELPYKPDEDTLKNLLLNCLERH